MTMLRMKDAYIEWTKQGRKYATTRMKFKPLGTYELISGSYYNPNRSGVKVLLYAILSWQPSTIPDEFKKTILIAEGFLPTQRFTWMQQWYDFLNLLEELNKRKIGEEEVMFTHFYKVTEGMLPPHESALEARGEGGGSE